MAKRGRKPNPNLPREGLCQVCGSHMSYTRDQSYRVSVGKYNPVCSVECLRERQRSGGLSGGIKFQSGREHRNWTGGLYTNAARQAGTLSAAIKRYIREGANQ